MTAENGIKSSPFLVDSNSKSLVYIVGFLTIIWINSPVLVSKTISPTSPNRFPVLLTTVFPNNCLEYFLSSSGIYNNNHGLFINFSYLQLLLWKLDFA